MSRFVSKMLNNNNYFIEHLRHLYHPLTDDSDLGGITTLATTVTTLSSKTLSLNNTIACGKLEMMRLK